MKRRGPTTAQLTEALGKVSKPGGRQLRFLSAHCRAPGRATTAAKLAVAAKYKSWRAINLRYGLLAEAIGRKLGKRGAGLGILLEFASPQSITNEQWVLVMRPEFANALRRSKWVREV